MNMADAKGWGALIAVGEKARQARHLDRSFIPENKDRDAVSAPLEGPDIALYLAHTTVAGRSCTRRYTRGRSAERRARNHCSMSRCPPSATTLGLSVFFSSIQEIQRQLSSGCSSVLDDLSAWGASW